VPAVESARLLPTDLYGSANPVERSTT
jgi:hypothetical protein